MFYIKNEQTNKIIYYNESKKEVEEAKSNFPDYFAATVYETAKRIVANSGDFRFEDDPELERQEKARQRTAIIKQLDSMDLKSIRAIRANDTEYIAQYEAQAAELRRQLQELDDESSSN